MPLSLVLLLYNCLLPVALLLLLPGSLLKMRRRGGYGSRLGERFGSYGADVRARLTAATDTWWLHAVSVGEVNVARKLISEILAQNPNQSILLSVTTTTGRDVAEKNAPAALTIIYSPLDLLWIVRRALRLIRPAQLILVEAEVWPNLVHRAHRTGIPVSLVNARLSHRSERRFRRLRGLVGPLFALLDRVLIQDPGDAARWASIGVRPAAIHHTGSMKYDLAGTTTQPDRIAEFRHLITQACGAHLPIILAASTHKGEESALAELLIKVRAAHPCIIAIAPRHFERRHDIRSALSAQGLSTAFRSEPPPTTPPDIYLIDSTGELREWQSLAHLVIIGKSFLAHGGQNPAEAIAAGVPVITGPHMENFAPLMHLLHGVAGITQVPDLPSLAETITAFLHSPDHLRTTAARGLAALESHRGATARTLAALGPP